MPRFNRITMPLLLALLWPPLFGTPLAAQPAGAVHVADLIGLPMVDEERASLGRVRGVVKTDDGKVQLLLPIGGLLGFGERLVAVPIETAALAGGTIALIDVPPHRFQESPTWYGRGSAALAATDTVSINKR